MKKLENVTSVEMPVDEKLEIKKMRFTPDGNDSWEKDQYRNRDSRR